MIERVDHGEFRGSHGGIERVWKIPARLCFLALALCSLSYGQMSYLNSSLQFLREGKLKEAEQEARLALADPSTRPVAWAAIGTIRLQQGKPRGSIRCLTKALQLNSHLIGARITLGEAYLFENDRKAARNAFKTALAFDPTNYNARLDLGKLEASVRQYQESLTVLHPIVRQLQKSSEGKLVLAADYLGLGESYLTSGNLDRAEANFELALELQPRCTVCAVDSAEVAERRGQTEKALALLLKLRQTNPDDPGVLFEFGKVCLERDLVDDALPALQKAVALKPDQNSYVYVLASAYVAKDRYSKALSLLNGLLREHPNDAVLNYAAGAVLYLENRYPQAQARLEKSIRLRPRQVAAYYYIGMSYERELQDQRAIDVFRNLLKHYPSHAPSYAALGTALMREKKYPEARQALERAISLDPRSAKAHYQLGILYGRLGRAKQSQQEIALSRKLEATQREKVGRDLRLLSPN